MRWIKRGLETWPEEAAADCDDEMEDKETHLEGQCQAYEMWGEWHYIVR